MFTSFDGSRGVQRMQYSCIAYVTPDKAEFPKFATGSPWLDGIILKYTTTTSFQVFPQLTIYIILSRIIRR
jgi:hypothetical protein